MRASETTVTDNLAADGTGGAISFPCALSRSARVDPANSQANPLTLINTPVFGNSPDDIVQ